ncbi:MAG: hypothetical protein RR389_08305 [Christensenella sp.]
MEMIFTVIGMVLAFLAGAYVRKPFCVFVKREKQIVESTKEQQSKDKQAEQLNNLMNYNGRVKEDE